MSTTTITILHCDFPGCTEQTPGHAEDGWTSAIHTHGCPAHGEAIAAHEATVESWNARRKDWWSLRCACGWTPRPGVSAWSSRDLKAKHLAHLAEVLAAGSWEPAEQPEPAHESFTKMQCTIVGAHERHSWSHKGEPCEGHICPGEAMVWPARGGTLPASGPQTTEEPRTWAPGDSPAEKLSSLWAQPHGGSCTCRECMATVEEADRA